MPGLSKAVWCGGHGQRFAGNRGEVRPLISRCRAKVARLVHNQKVVGSNPAPAIMSMEVKDIRDFLDNLEDDQELVFACVHNDDLKYFLRSFENNVAIITDHGLLVSKAFGAGSIGSVTKPSKETAAIFLCKL